MKIMQSKIAVFLYEGDHFNRISSRHISKGGLEKTVKKAKDGWKGIQCEEIETWLNKSNSNRAYQLVKDLSSEKQGRSAFIQDRSGKCPTKEKRFSADGQNIA